MHIPSVLAAAVGALAARAALPHVLRLKLRHDVERLNAGDHRALLAGFADDAVLHFNQGAHRWSGSHVGKDAIERFLQDFIAAGLHGELGRTWFSGPPWALHSAYGSTTKPTDRTAKRSTRTASSSGHGPVGARSSISATFMRTPPESPNSRPDFRTSAYSHARRPSLCRVTSEQSAALCRPPCPTRRLRSPGRSAQGMTCRHPAEAPVVACLRSSARSSGPPSRPLLVVLDDLHGADPLSLHLLRFLVSRLGTLPVVVLATLRDSVADRTDALVHTLAALARERTTTRLRLDGTRQPRRSANCSPTAACTTLRCRWSCGTGRGNPFFLVELLELMRSERRLRSGGTFRAGRAGSPSRSGTCWSGGWVRAASISTASVLTRAAANGSRGRSRCARR